MSAPEITTQDAILAAVRAAVPSVTVYDGDVPDKPAARYVVLWTNIGTVSNATLRGRMDSAAFRFQVTSVASGPGKLRSECQWLAVAIRNALAGKALTASDWRLSAITHLDSMSPTRDATVLDRTTLYAVDSYSCIGSSF